MKCLLGKKVGMSRVFRGENAIPVTLLSAGPCFVTQIRTNDQDGYSAVQLSYGQKKKISQPLAGHLKKAKVASAQFIHEFKVDNASDYKLGQEIKAAIFSAGDELTISALSKGKGFMGVVKRHGFHGAPATHGHKHDHRAPGSIGSGFPEHVFKGMRMGGRTGHGRVTIKNIEVIDVDAGKNLLAVKGAVPGARNTLVEIQSIASGESEKKES